MQRSKYQSLTIKRKLEIIDLVDQAPPGKKKKDIANEAGIPASTLSTLLKNRDSLRAGHATGSNKKKRARDPVRPDVDAALFQWFSAARAQSVPISGEILKAKAEELATELDPDHVEWTCSNGWLCRWKVRHNISYKAVSGENAVVSKEVCEDWKKSTLSPLLQRYHPNDVFNADETGLYWISVGDIAMSFDPSATADDEVDDFGDPLPRVSVQQANSAFQDIQAFLLRNTTNADKTYKLLRELDIDLLASTNNACVQTSIFDFFKPTS